VRERDDGGGEVVACLCFTRYAPYAPASVVAALPCDTLSRDAIIL